MILAQDSASFASDAAIMEELMNDLNGSIEFLDTIYSNGDIDRGNLDEYMALIAQWETTANLALDQIQRKDYAGAQATLNQSMTVRLEMVDVATRMTENVEEIRNTTVDSNRAQTIHASYSIIILLIISIVISIILTLRLTYKALEFLPRLLVYHCNIFPK